MAENKRELVEQALNNQPVSRVPVGFWHHFLEAPRYDDAFEHRKLEERNLALHDAFYQSWYPDVIKVMTDGFFQYQQPKLFNLASIDDAKEIKPLGRDSEWVERQVQFASRLTERYGKEVQIFYNLFAPVRTLEISQVNAEGKQEVLRYLKEDPEALKEVLSILAEDLSTLSKALIQEAHIDGIYLSVHNISKTAITPEVYRDVIAPSEKTVLQAANDASKDPKSILHICGWNGFYNHLDWYVDYPFKAVNWAVKVEGVSLTEGKKLFGNRAVIGGFGQAEGDLIHKGSKEAIQEETRHILREAGTTGIILGADCTVPKDTPVSHFEWVREAAAHFEQ